MSRQPRERHISVRDQDKLRADATRFLIHAANAVQGWQPDDLAIALIDTGRALYAIAQLDTGTGSHAYTDVMRALEATRT